MHTLVIRHRCIPAYVCMFDATALVSRLPPQTQFPFSGMPVSHAKKSAGSSKRSRLVKTAVADMDLPPDAGVEVGSYITQRMPVCFYFSFFFLYENCLHSPCEMLHARTHTLSLSLFFFFFSFSFFIFFLSLSLSLSLSLAFPLSFANAHTYAQTHTHTNKHSHTHTQTTATDDFDSTIFIASPTCACSLSHSHLYFMRIAYTRAPLIVSQSH